MRGLSSLFLLLFFSSCSTRPVAVQPVEVKVPVTVSCEYSIIPEPDWNVVQLAPGATLTEKLKAVLADDELSHGYMEELEAMLEACG